MSRRLAVILGFGLFVAALALLIPACKGDLSGTNNQCVPNCGSGAKECGTDGCGGFCGECPPGESCTTEGRCVSSFCGNGRVDTGESCDSAITEGAGVCPTECPDDGNQCTQETLFGFSEDCDSECRATVINDCSPGDGCCPAGCNAANDLDCSANCDNGVVDTEDGETCDPPSSCPTEADCDDMDPCTNDSLTGSAANCSAACANIPITEAANGDGCCPPGEDGSTDDDCMFVCGNGTVEMPQETCDNMIEAGMPGACPEDAAACDDNNGCTTDEFTGSPDNCSALCTNTVAITDPINDDGCCPTGATEANDNDCVAVCDNGTIEAGEVCDPIATCPTACDDQDACTTDTLMGDAQMCTAECQFDPITACGAAEGCCPATCTPTMDSDCTALCTQMCDLADANCPGVDYPYTDRAECDTQCAAYVSGNSTDQTGDTIYCRINALVQAANDAAMYCPWAAQTSPQCQ